MSFSNSDSSSSVRVCISIDTGADGVDSAVVQGVFIEGPDHILEGWSEIRHRKAEVVRVHAWKGAGVQGVELTSWVTEAQAERLKSFAGLTGHEVYLRVCLEKKGGAEIIKVIDDHNGKEAYVSVLRLSEGDGGPHVFCAGYLGSRFCLNPLVVVDGRVHLSRWSVGGSVNEEYSSWPEEIVFEGAWGQEGYVVTPEKACPSLEEIKEANKARAVWLEGDALPELNLLEEVEAIVDELTEEGVYQEEDAQANWERYAQEVEEDEEEVAAALAVHMLARYPSIKRELDAASTVWQIEAIRYERRFGEEPGSQVRTPDGDLRTAWDAMVHAACDAALEEHVEKALKEVTVTLSAPKAEAILATCQTFAQVVLGHENPWFESWKKELHGDESLEEVSRQWRDKKWQEYLVARETFPMALRSDLLWERHLAGPDEGHSLACDAWLAHKGSN
tara:strand:- start:9732 stop:11072 length:1341 start_codon:yes stop_codon:yes gene_type:complete